MHNSTAATTFIGQSMAAASGTERPRFAEQGATISRQLHDLAQPLTALECLLFLGTLEGEAAGQGPLRQTICDALVQCQRLMVGVRAMQDSLHGC